MPIERAVTLAVSPQLVLQGLADVSGKDLAAIAGTATSSGKALLQESGLERPDEASHCHFGAQLGRPASRGATTVLALRWWNDKSRSLTPGFIGQIRVRPVRPLQGQLTELSILGQYHPRAHLYELVDRAFLNRMATAVVASFLDRLQDRIVEFTSRPAEVHSVAS